MHLPDKLPVGLLAGFVTPPLFMLGFYVVAFASKMPFASFLNQMADAHRFSAMLAFGLLGNLLPFFFFYRLKSDRAANGVIGATLVLGAIIVYLKLIA